MQAFHWNSASNTDAKGQRDVWYNVVDRKAPEIGKHFNEGQLENRVNTIKLAYKQARQLIKDIAVS